MRRTKIVATLGPASDPPEVVAALLDVGVDVVRLGLAHGEAKEHVERIELVRDIAEGRGRKVVATAATLCVQPTALHVQPALITLMALGLYVAFRTLCPPLGVAAWPAVRRAWPGWLLRRVALGAGMLATAVGLGIALATAQLWPLYELGIQSFRGVGAPFAFSTTYSVHPSQLMTLLFPYFFRGGTGGQWQLWAGWETLVYVGIAPLILALVGLVAVRRREVGFFGLLGVFGALMAFG